MGLGSWADWFSGTMSFIAVAVALLGYSIASFQRKADQRERDETAARLLVMKVFQLVNRTDDIYRPLVEALARPPMDGLWGDQKWRRVRGVTGVRDDTGLALDGSQEDMLIRLGEYSLLMSLMLEISRYRTLTQHMRDYVVRRDALLELHPAPVEVDGVHAVLHLDRAEVMRVLPYANALEALIKEILEQAEDNRTNTRALGPACNDFVKKHFPRTKFPKLLAPNP
ncbi:hypothetical protein ASD21_17970 [Caulobacter sp. Root1455]|nr:hypothetical protein ASD21_17970 [Caulobacter sp. Root1455]